jgi:hypothetical protein
MANSARWGGTDSRVDPIAVSDDQGHFDFSCKSDLSAINVLAEARGAAKRWARLIPGRDHLLQLEEGVLVTGRLLLEHRPAKGVIVGLVTTDRSAGVCLHDFEAATNPDGRFAIYSVSPDRAYYFFTRMESLGDQGTLPVKTLHAGPSGTTLDLGDLEVKAAHRIEGKIVLSDGKAIPPETRLLLSREQAWDHADAALDADGRFAFSGVPTESVSLSVRVSGYKFSKQNLSLDWLNGSIIGKVDADVTGLTLVMEPGQWRFSGGERADLPPGRDLQPRNQPLRGAPAKK